MHDQEFSYFRDPEFLEILSKWEDIDKRGDGGYMDADDLADVAEYYYVSHQRAKGDHCIDFAMQLHPTATCTLTFKARSLMLQHRNDEAMALLDTADDQNNREVVYLRAEMMIQDGKRRAAEQLLQEHVPSDEEDIADDDDEEDESHDEGPQSYMREVIGLWLDYDDITYAGLWADRLRTLPDLTTKDYIMLADYANIAGQNKVAYSILQGIIKEDPYNISVWNLLAEVAFDEERFNDAAEACETVLAIEENNYQAYTQLARIHLAVGNTGEVIRMMQKGRELWPEDDICPLYEGMVYSQQYSQQEHVDIALLKRAHDCIAEAERKADGQSAEQANIVLNMAYIMGEYYFNAPNDTLRKEYKQRVIDYVKQMQNYGKEKCQVAFQLSNMLLEMGENDLANELLGGTLQRVTQ